MELSCLNRAVSRHVNFIRCCQVTCGGSRSGPASHWEAPSGGGPGTRPVPGPFQPKRLRLIRAALSKYPRANLHPHTTGHRKRPRNVPSRLQAANMPNVPAASAFATRGSLPTRTITTGPGRAAPRACDIRCEPGTGWHPGHHESCTSPGQT